MQVDRKKELAELVTSVEEFCQRVQDGLANATFEQKRQLVELLIDRVIVTNGDVEIRYIIPTSPSSEHVRFCHLRSDYFYDPAFIPLLIRTFTQKVSALGLSHVVVPFLAIGYPPPQRFAGRAVDQAA